MRPNVPPVTFLNLAKSRYGHTCVEDYYPNGMTSEYRRYKENFFLSPIETSVLFGKLQESFETNGLASIGPHHLLDALFFLNVHPTESPHAMIAGTDEKTLRKWNWCMIEEFAKGIG